ncbi:MAG: HEAT repeat domain-containing protein [Nitrospira sp.]|nr:HEAT repeat domain-containing protein [Nitrospira sp.]
MTDSVMEQIAALRDEDWAVREDAARLLGTFKDPRAVTPLIALLRDQDRSVREAAIEALRAIGKESVEALGTCLDQPDLSVQEAASAILSTIADERVLPSLIQALRSSDWIVRMHAAKALGLIRHTDTVVPLIPLLQDKVKAVREEAAAGLAAIGDPAIPSLVDALRQEEWLVRLHAVEALGKSRSAQAVEPLLSVLFNDHDSAVREDAVRALGAIRDPRAVEYLLTAMREPGLRTLAVEALGRIGDTRAVPVLIEVLTGAKPPEATRAVAGCGDQWNEEFITQGAAARALGLIGDEAAIPSLVNALGQTYTRADAAAALAAFGAKVVPFLIPLLTDSTDDNVQFHVRETLTLAGWRPRRASTIHS